jgi:hypothetical protein
VLCCPIGIIVKERKRRSKVKICESDRAAELGAKFVCQMEEEAKEKSSFEHFKTGFHQKKTRILQVQSHNTERV